MMFLLGLCGSGFLVYFAVRMANVDIAAIANDPGVGIVVGGTFVALIGSAKLRDLAGLFRATIAAIRGRSLNEATVVRALSHWAAHRRGPPPQVRYIDQHPVWQAGVRLVEARIDAQRVTGALSTSQRERQGRLNHYAEVVRGVGRYPPAFGMIGTVLGMVALLRGIAGSAAGHETAGHVATALLATFYGLLLANCVLLPWGDYLANYARSDARLGRLMTYGFGLIAAGEDPVLVAEALQAFVESPSDSQSAEYSDSVSPRVA